MIIERMMFREEVVNIVVMSVMFRVDWNLLDKNSELISMMI